MDSVFNYSNYVPIVFVIIVVLMVAASAVRILPEYERGVLFRLGRLAGTRGPGLFFIIPGIDRLVRVSLRTVAFDVPPQDVITHDNGWSRNGTRTRAQPFLTSANSMPITLQNGLRF